MHLHALLFGCTLVALSHLPSISGISSVIIGDTTLIGRSDPLTGLELFGGIPYAEPPLGPLRLRLPVPKFTLESPEFNASSYGAQCLQWPTSPSSDTPSSEDCLTVSVLRPAGLTSDAQLPVLVFVHGGGFTEGSSALYAGDALVIQSITRGTPVIFVNFQYRLGPLGFPQGQEATENGVLNLGLRDQLVALEWIHRNIGAFGGDNDKITVFGQSAGAVSIGVLLLTSGIEKFARGAILHSGSAATTATFDGRHRQGLWDNFVATLSGCSSAPHGETFECVRKADSEDIYATLETVTRSNVEQFPWVPVIDGPGGLMPELPSVLYQHGLTPKIPFISGCNLDEGTFIAAPASGISSPNLTKEWIVTNYSTGASDNTKELERAVDHLLQVYPDDPALGSPFNTGDETFGLHREFKRLSAIFGDVMFHSTRRLLLAKAASASSVKQYGYLFTDPSPVNEAFFPWAGVMHGNDLYYTFGFLARVNGSDEAMALATQMRDYWISFAVGLDPNDGLGAERPLWPQYAVDRPVLLELNRETLGVIPDTYRAANIGFLNENAHLFLH